MTVRGGGPLQATGTGSARFEQERDIELVLVTGAGASRAFGMNGTPMSLMGDWADALVTKLAGADASYLRATGLSTKLSGEEFETHLGGFLRRVEAFRQVKDMLDLTAQLPQSPVSITSQALSEWHRNSTFHFDQILKVVHESLYEQFGDGSADRGAATQAYADLLHALDASTSSLVYATTNYDTIGEYALQHLGRRPNWGELVSVDNAADRPLDVRGLIGDFKRYVPVLHLHGRIGWYRRPEGRAYATGATQFQSELGVPIVMLPDPDKAYAGVDIIDDLWTEFILALQRAKRVFVLGHSLNDRHLVRAIVDNVEPLERVAVAALADAAGQFVDKAALNVVNAVKNQLAGAATIPMRFGHQIEVACPAIDDWLDKLVRGDLA